MAGGPKQRETRVRAARPAKGSANASATARGEQLAAELRENLRRRKRQQRLRASRPAEGGTAKS